MTTEEVSKAKNVILIIPEFVEGGDRLAIMLQNRYNGLVELHRPGSDGDFVTLMATGRFVLTREMFQQARTGLIWEKLASLVAEGHVVNHNANEIAFDVNPPDHEGAGQYQDHRRVGANKTMPPAWAVGIGLRYTHLHK